MIQVQIRWVANPFRGDKFAEGWRPAAEAVLDFGATQWSFTARRTGGSTSSRRDFPSKAHFERYWYSERIAEFRVELSGAYQVPILPTFWEIVGAGEAVAARAALIQDAGLAGRCPVCDRFGRNRLRQPRGVPRRGDGERPRADAPTSS